MKQGVRRFQEIRTEKKRDKANVINISKQSPNCKKYENWSIRAIINNNKNRLSLIDRDCSKEDQIDEESIGESYHRLINIICVRVRENHEVSSSYFDFLTIEISFILIVINFNEQW